MSRGKGLDPGQPPARRKGLDPGGPLPRRRTRPRRREQPSTPPTVTAPANPTVAARRVENEVRVIVYDRATWDGETTARCEWCAVVVRFVDFSMHHRLPGQMGGDTRSYWHPSRLMLLCGSGTTGCHGRVESNRAMAYMLGLLVKRGPLSVNPADWCAGMPVLVGGGADSTARDLLGRDLLDRRCDWWDCVPADADAIELWRRYDAGRPVYLTCWGGYEVAA